MSQASSPAMPQLRARSSRAERRSSVSVDRWHKSQEGLLCKAVFARFSSLSSFAQQQLMSSWLKSTDRLGKFETMDLLLNGSQRRVEPNIVMRFSRATVLIDAKSVAGFEQGRDQRQQELEGLLLPELDESHRVYVLFVGAASDFDAADSSLALLPENGHAVHAVSSITWVQVLKTLLKLQRRLALKGQSERVVDKMCLTLQLVGFSSLQLEWTDFRRNSLPMLGLEHRCLAAPAPAQSVFDAVLSFAQLYNNQNIQNLPPLTLECMHAWETKNQPNFFYRCAQRIAYWRPTTSDC